jgi:hypothetical protein
MKENNFKNLYKTWTTDKLLDIIDNPNEYQPLSVEAAQMEIDSRQLSEKQLDEAKKIQSARLFEKDSKHQKVKAVEDKLKSVGTSLADSLNPIQKELPSTDKYIKLISLLFVGLFLYQLIKDFKLLRYTLFDDNGRWDFSMVLYFILFLLLPAAGLLLWFRKKIGWILATVFFSYSASFAILLFIKTFNYTPSGFPAIDNLFPTPSPTVYILTLLFYGGLIWIMSKSNIRELYNIGKPDMFITIGIGVVIVLFIAFSM